VLHSSVDRPDCAAQKFVRDAAGWMEGLGREMGNRLAVLGVLMFSEMDKGGRVVDDATPNLRREGLWSVSIKGQEEFREELAKLLTKGRG
jgi:hypothetical protein